MESQRMKLVQDPIIPIVGELISKNPGTISLGQGVVYYPPPPGVADRIAGFMADPSRHKYQPVTGIPELQDRLKEKLQTENNIPIGNGNSIMVTAGGNMAFLNAVLAVSDPGDEIILQLPYYFNHEMAVAIAGCRAVCIPADAGYQLQPGLIEKAVTPRTRAIVTISPNNPTGVVYPAEALREVNAVCRRHHCYHINDEAYEYFTYDNAAHFSPGSLPGAGKYTISLFSLSKAYGFASWRIGYMVVPDHLFMAVKKIQDTNLICPPVISQYAALAALQAGRDYCLKQRAAIEKVRLFFLQELKSIADIIDVPPAGGAFYFFLRLHSSMDMMEIVRRLIEKHRVAVIPGLTFGISEGCYIRAAYGALEEQTAVSGIRRLVDGLKAITGEPG